MKKNNMGVVVSVKQISEIADNMAHCSSCGADAIPSYDCDYFPQQDKADSSGETPLVCEKCLTKGMKVFDPFKSVIR